MKTRFVADANHCLCENLLYAALFRMELHRHTQKTEVYYCILAKFAAFVSLYPLVNCN